MRLRRADGKRQVLLVELKDLARPLQLAPDAVDEHPHLLGRAGDRQVIPPPSLQWPVAHAVLHHRPAVPHVDRGVVARDVDAEPRLRVIAVGPLGDDAGVVARVRSEIEPEPELDRGFREVQLGRASHRDVAALFQHHRLGVAGPLDELRRATLGLGIGLALGDLEIPVKGPIPHQVRLGGDQLRVRLGPRIGRSQRRRSDEARMAAKSIAQSRPNFIAAEEPNREAMTSTSLHALV